MQSVVVLNFKNQCPKREIVLRPSKKTKLILQILKEIFLKIKKNPRWNLIKICKKAQVCSITKSFRSSIMDMIVMIQSWGIRSSI